MNGIAQKGMRVNRKIFLATESLAAGNGGIARVARLMAKVIGEGIAAGQLQGEAAAFSDAVADAAYGLPAWTARRSRCRYFLHVQRAVFGCSHFLYDSVNMARAHRLLLGVMRPMLVFIHGIEVWENRAPKWIRAAHRANFLVANTAYTRDRAERIHGGFKHAKVCWLATDTDDPPAPVARSGGPPVVLIVSRIDDELYKGHPQLIACWPKVVSAAPDARLVIVGSGPKLVTVKQMAAASAVASSIEVRGFVPEEQMEKVWGEASVFAMPSRGEGFGLVYIEAMRHGLPVISSVHDAAPEINLDGQTGYNVNLDRPSDLGERVIQLLRDPDHAAALGRNGQARWREFFSYQAFRARFRPLLQEFLAS